MAKQSGDKADQGQAIDWDSEWRWVIPSIQKGRPNNERIARLLRQQPPFIPEAVLGYLASTLDGTFKARRGPKPGRGTPFRRMFLAMYREEKQKLIAEGEKDPHHAACERVAELSQSLLTKVTPRLVDSWVYPRKKSSRTAKRPIPAK